MCWATSKAKLDDLELRPMIFHLSQVSLTSCTIGQSTEHHLLSSEIVSYPLTQSKISDYREGGLY